MKIVIALAILFVSSPSFAFDPFETKDEARERHSSDNYDYYEKNGTPLGGYPEKLGDPAPEGTDRPGYNDTYDYYGKDDK